MIDISNIRFQHPIFKKSRKVIVRFIIYEIKHIKNYFLEFSSENYRTHVNFYDLYMKQYV